MQVVTADLIKGKKILLRYDIDVALKEENGKMVIGEDFKLRAGIPTLKLCLENASKTIIIGHLGRPFATAEDEKNDQPEELSAKPIQEWFEKELGADVEFAPNLEAVQQSNSKLILLENIRFFHGEVPGAKYHATCTSKTCDIDFASQLASLGDFYVNEAFSSYNPAASTTIVPTLLPHAAGLNFFREVKVLTRVRNNPQKPFIAIMGGAKVKDKLPIITLLSKNADAVLVGGQLIHDIREQNIILPKNVMVGKLSEDGFDISPETTSAWGELISKAAMIVWNGPLGKFEDPKYNQTQKVAEMILESSGEVVIGGGDSIAALGKYKLLQEAEEKAFVSVGGGAMLKLLAEGTLPTIEALK